MEQKLNMKQTFGKSFTAYAARAGKQVVKSVLKHKVKIDYAWESPNKYIHTYRHVQAENLYYGRQEAQQSKVWPTVRQKRPSRWPYRRNRK